MKAFLSHENLHCVINGLSPSALLFALPEAVAESAREGLASSAKEGLHATNSLVCAMGHGAVRALAFSHSPTLPFDGRPISQSTATLLAARRAFTHTLPRATPLYGAVSLPAVPFMVGSTIFQLARKEAHALNDQVNQPNAGGRQALALGLMLGASLLTEGSRFGFAVLYAGTCVLVAAAGALYGAGMFLYSTLPNHPTPPAQPRRAGKGRAAFVPVPPTYPKVPHAPARIADDVDALSASDEEDYAQARASGSDTPNA